MAAADISGQTGRVRGLGILVAAAVLLVGCGSRTDAPGSGSDNQVPITSRAIAAVALDHVPDDTTSRGPTYVDDTDPPGSVGADLRYHGGGESDGELLRVLVEPGHGPKRLCREIGDHCRSREVDGGVLSVVWAEQVPEEDPGYVAVLMQRRDERVTALWSGEDIRGNPAEQDLFIPVSTLEEIARDSRISLTTSASVVAAGEQLDDWNDE
jgi:hypothetical protein